MRNFVELRFNMIRVMLLLWLILLLVVPANAQYDRHSYGGWLDKDGDCLNTRHEVLLEESLIPPTIVNCKVIKGLWYDLYTGQTFTDPRKLDVDHVVPLKEADISGGSFWSHEKKQRYANDLSNPGHLIAVSASANRSKGSKDIARWLPKNLQFHCAYVRLWLEVKTRWALTMDDAEAKAIADMLTDCE